LRTFHLFIKNVNFIERSISFLLFYSKNNLPFSRQNYSTLADCVACDYDEEDVALDFVAVALLI
jgi:hypothetical protein